MTFLTPVLEGEVTNAFKEMKLREETHPLRMNVINLAEISDHISRMQDPGTTAVQVLHSRFPKAKIELKATIRKGMDKEVQLSDMREELDKILLRVNRAVLGQHLMCYVSKKFDFKSELMDDQASVWCNVLSKVLNNYHDNGPERELTEHELQFRHAVCWGTAVAQYPWLPIYASELFDLIFNTEYLKMQPLLANFIVELGRKTPAPPSELGKGFLVLNNAREET
jgi:hypothetical protein